VFNEDNFYIIKQSDGTLWNLTYDEDKGIIYKLLEKGSWSDYQLAASNGTKIFSAVLLPDDSISVLYQDTKKNIYLSNYREKRWSEQQILKNENSDLFNIYFKAIVSENQIHIIYSILNKISGFSKIFHQTLDREGNLSSPKMIDEIKYDYKNPFNIYGEGSKEIFIVYQKFEDTHKLIYKALNIETKSWPKLYVIDSSPFPYKDYCLLAINGKLHVLYIKHDQNQVTLTYAHCSNEHIKHNILCKETNIDSCTLFILYNQIWGSWIQGNKIYSSFSIDNGSTFSNPPYYKSLDSLNIIKAIYISNNFFEKRYTIFTNSYLIRDDELKCNVFSNVYINPYDISNNVLSYIVYFNDKVFEKILLYAKEIKQQDQFINEMKYMQREQELKNLAYQKKLEEVNRVYAKFREGKQLLDENINFLQNSLISKEERINQLENINIERENQLLFLKEENKKLNENIKSLQEKSYIESQKTNELENIKTEKENQLICDKEKIENLNKEVEELRAQLNSANQKLNNSFLKRIFGE
jgi:hypothetical protein